MAAQDPLLQPENLSRLKAEVDACFVDGTPDKSRLSLAYPDYFFDLRDNEIPSGSRSGSPP